MQTCLQCFENKGEVEELNTSSVDIGAIGGSPLCIECQPQLLKGSSCICFVPTHLFEPKEILEGVVRGAREGRESIWASEEMPEGEQPCGIGLVVE